MKHGLALVALLVLGVPTAAWAGDLTYAKEIVPHEPLISSLTTNESLEVTYTSVGCFHGTRYRFEIRGWPHDVRIYEESLEPGQAGSLLGAATLAEADANRLDAAIAFYRSEPPGGCTSKKEYKLVWQREDGTFEETLLDATCGRYGLPAASFEDLLDRVGEAR